MKNQTTWEKIKNSKKTIFYSIAAFLFFGLLFVAFPAVFYTELPPTELVGAYISLTLGSFAIAVLPSLFAWKLIESFIPGDFPRREVIKAIIIGVGITMLLASAFYFFIPSFLRTDASSTFLAVSVGGGLDVYGLGMIICGAALLVTLISIPILSGKKEAAEAVLVPPELTDALVVQIPEEGTVVFKPTTELMYWGIATDEGNRYTCLLERCETEPMFSIADNLRYNRGLETPLPADPVAPLTDVSSPASYHDGGIRYGMFYSVAGGSGVPFRAHLGYVPGELGSEHRGHEKHFKIDQVSVVEAEPDSGAGVGGAEGAPAQEPPRFLASDRSFFGKGATADQVTVRTTGFGLQ